MMILRFLAKVIVIPVVLAVTLVEWFLVFLVSISSVVFNLLAAVTFITAVVSYLMGLSDGSEALELIVMGFVIFMIPVAGDGIVKIFAAINMAMRDFIWS